METEYRNMKRKSYNYDFNLKKVSISKKVREVIEETRKHSWNVNLINLSRLKPATHCVFVSIANLSNENDDYRGLHELQPEAPIFRLIECFCITQRISMPFFYLPLYEFVESKHWIERQKIPTSGFHFWHPRRQRSLCLRSLLYSVELSPERDEVLAGMGMGKGGRGTC